MLSLERFFGGLFLDGNKRVSTQTPIRDMPLSQRLMIPLVQRNGLEAHELLPIGSRVLKGTAIGGGSNPMDPWILAPTSGYLKAIEQYTLPHPSGLSGKTWVLEPDGLDEPIDLPALKHYHTLTTEALINRIEQAGITGLGGAAFPTAAKFKSPLNAIDTLIINGAECEPYITCDEALMKERPDLILQGAYIAAHLLKATQCLIALENDKYDAIGAVTTALNAHKNRTIELVKVPSIYPVGGEKQLIKTITGREVPSGGIPADIGILCINVGTCAAIARAVLCGEPLHSRIVTVTGQGVLNPQNVKVHFGTPLADVIAFCGGYTEKATQLILGGPMMGFSVSTDEIPIAHNVNTLLIAGSKEIRDREQPSSPCIRCGDCATVCPMQLTPQQMYWYVKSDQLDRAVDYHLSDCIECGSCDVVCPSHIPLTQFFRSGKTQLKLKEHGLQMAERARLRFEDRQVRLDASEREKAAALLQRKTKLEQGTNPEIQQAIERAKHKRAEKLKQVALIPPQLNSGSED